MFSKNARIYSWKDEIFMRDLLGTFLISATICGVIYQISVTGRNITVFEQLWPHCKSSLLKLLAGHLWAKHAFLYSCCLCDLSVVKNDIFKLSTEKIIGTHQDHVILMKKLF